VGFKSVVVNIQEEAQTVDLTVEQGATWKVVFKVNLPPTGDGLSEAVRASIATPKMQIRSTYGGTLVKDVSANLTLAIATANEFTVTLEVAHADTTAIVVPSVAGRTAAPGLTGRTRLGVYDLEVTVTTRKWRVCGGTVYISPEVTTV
jgi:hypothetical protein